MEQLRREFYKEDRSLCVGRIPEHQLSRYERFAQLPPPTSNCDVNVMLLWDYFTFKIQMGIDLEEANWMIPPTFPEMKDEVLFLCKAKNSRLDVIINNLNFLFFLLGKDTMLPFVHSSLKESPRTEIWKNACTQIAPIMYS